MRSARIHQTFTRCALARRANGDMTKLSTYYDGYAECVKTVFDPKVITIEKLMVYFFEIIDPYSLNKQGNDIGKKYRTGFYSEKTYHLKKAQTYIKNRKDYKRIAVEILLINYVRSAEEHQDRLVRFPSDYCHIPKEKLYKYKK